jgi:hypothetical protein
MKDEKMFILDHRFIYLRILFPEGGGGKSGTGSLVDWLLDI